MIGLNKFAKSLSHAWRGLNEVYARENSFRVHLLAFILLVAVIIGLGITGIEAAVHPVALELSRWIVMVLPYTPATEKLLPI